MAKTKPQLRTVSFTATPDEREIIRMIIERIEQLDLLVGYDRESLEMDLIATHANGCPIDFNKLFNFGRFDFMHDISGIVRHLDRRSGELTGFFLPRCALPAQSGNGVANG